MCNVTEAESMNFHFVYCKITIIWTTQIIYYMTRKHNYIWFINKFDSLYVYGMWTWLAWRPYLNFVFSVEQELPTLTRAICIICLSFRCGDIWRLRFIYLIDIQRKMVLQFFFLVKACKMEYSFYFFELYCYLFDKWQCKSKLDMIIC